MREVIASIQSDVRMIHSYHNAVEESIKRGLTYEAQKYARMSGRIANGVLSPIYFFEEKECRQFESNVGSERGVCQLMTPDME